MILIDMIFLIVVINAATGSLYMLFWKRYAGKLEKKAEYVRIYRLLRIGILFFLLPGLIVILPTKVLWSFMFTGFADWSLSGKILIPLWSALTVFWLFGVVCNTYKWIREVYDFCRICRYNMEITNTKLREKFEQISERQHVFSNLTVYKNPMIQIPVIFGVMGHTVLLPEGCEHLEELQIILEHEMIHARNRDLLAERTALFLHLLCWFTPLSGQMVSAMEEWSETVCDIIVCGSENSIWSKRQYFNLIVSWAQEEHSVTAGTAMALSGNYARIKTRILRMQKYDALGKYLSGDVVSIGSRLGILCCCVLLSISFGIQNLGNHALIRYQTRNLENCLNWDTAVRSGGQYQQKSVVIRSGEILTDSIQLEEGEHIRIGCEIEAMDSYADDGRGICAYFGISPVSGGKEDMVPYSSGIFESDFTAQETGQYELVFENASKKEGGGNIRVNYIIWIK